jgi:hypothetical protein
VERISAQRVPGFALSDLYVLLSEVREDVRNHPLRPPAETQFYKSALLPPAGASQGARGLELSPAHGDALRALAIDLIGAYLGEGCKEGTRPDPGHVAIHSAALQYAEAVVRQEEILADLECAAADISSMHSALVSGDEARIQDLCLYRRSRRLDALLGSWESCVGSVERSSSSLMYEEYENWLDMRDVLEDMVEVLSPAGRQTLGHALAPLDERFLAATRDLSSSIRPRSRWRPQRWWWYRVPHRPSETFRERLEHVAPVAATEVSAVTRPATDS